MGMTRKVALLVYIPEDLNRKLREFIALKYRKFEKGLLSWEVEQALSHWIALHTKAQKTLTTKGPNPTPLVVRAFMEVKQYLLMNYYEELKPGMTVPDGYMREAISAVRGSDPRTVRKWLRTFTRFKLIKPVGGVWEIVG